MIGRMASLFISHAWRCHDDCDRIVALLNATPYFTWQNYSVPLRNPLNAGSSAALARELDDQIRPAQVVVILAGIYVSHSPWIQYEIDRSVGWGKPIIGVRPWASERVPSAVAEAADEIVGWNTSSIVDGIRRASQ